MPNRILRITTHLPAIPAWLKIENSITVPLPLERAKALAKELLAVQEDIEIKISFATGKKTTVEIKFEPKKEAGVDSSPLQDES